MRDCIIVQNRSERSLSGCISVRAVLNETLRLFCPLHGSIRQSLDYGVILPASDATYNREPMYLPPNSPVFTLPLLLQRNEALWGPDAHIYDPDRWLDERLQRVTDNPSIFIPFGAGPRNVSGLCNRCKLKYG